MEAMGTNNEINNEAAARLEAAEDVLSEKEFKDCIFADDEWQDVDISEDWLNPADAYDKPTYTLAYKGVPFAPLGGIHALTGQPGNGKTMTFTQFMVAILAGRYGDLTYECEDSHPYRSVLYVDTEMEKGNTQLVQLRVYTMMNWAYKTPHPEFRIIRLRDTENAVDRWKKTLKAIDEMKPTVVFIDGLLDIVSDFNDNKECQVLIYKAMKLASYYGISIWCLVHENPGATKMVGHLGSILERKVTDNFGTVKTKDDATGVVTFTIKQKKARGKDVQDIKFRMIDGENRYGIPEQIDCTPGEVFGKQNEIDELREVFSAIEYPAEGLCKYDFRNILISKGVWKSPSTIIKKVEKADELGILVGHHDSKNIVRYHLSTENNQNTEKELPF